MKKFFVIFYIYHILGFSYVDDGVRAQSFGGAYRSIADTNNAIFYNSAGLIKNRRFSFDADYIYHKNLKENRISASISDSSLTEWALGLAYSGHLKNQIDSNHNLFLGLAMPIIINNFALGTTLSYKYKPDFKTEKHNHFFNMDLGFLYNYYFSFAIVLGQIIPKKENEDPMSLSLAASYNFEQIFPLLLSFDWSMDNFLGEEKLDHVLATGLEYKIFPIWPIRIGLKSILKEEKNFISLGTGLLLGMFDLDALYQQNLSLGKEKLLGVSLRFYF